MVLFVFCVIYIITSPLLQDRSSMAHCKLVDAGYNDQDRPCRHHLRLQGPRWYLCPINGNWSELRENGGDFCQGDVQVGF